MNDGLWLKGCLHCHSRTSDGLLSFEDVARYYEARGYRLLSITDHEKISRFKGFKGVCQSGTELSRGKGKLGEPYHLVILGVDDSSILTIGDVQTLMDEVAEMGGLTLIAHPYWSNMVHEDLANLEGYAGIEVYNTGCDVEVAKGYSSMHWDNLLSLRRPIWGLAVDDAHRYTVYPIDADGGWIWIRVEEEEPHAVLKALKKGEFYSSMAPQIRLFNFSNGCLDVESTPVSRVDIMAPDGRGMSITAGLISEFLKSWRDPHERSVYNSIDNMDCLEERGKREIYMETKKNERLMVKIEGEGITKLVFKREFKYSYFRVELTDGEGRHAWANPVFSS